VKTLLVRGISGIVLVVLGAVWIAQGSGAMSGSGMSGHAQYAVLGVVVVLIGLFLLMRAWRLRASRGGTDPK
jgi:asparagine N-glycosylation enzyme membrane subunit Stt3